MDVKREHWQRDTDDEEGDQDHRHDRQDFSGRRAAAAGPEMAAAMTPGYLARRIIAVRAPGTCSASTPATIAPSLTSPRE